MRNSPSAAPAWNASHSSSVKWRTGPVGSFELRTSTVPSPGRRISTHEGSFMEYEDLYQSFSILGLGTGVSLGSSRVPDLVGVGSGYATGSLAVRSGPGGEVFGNRLFLIVSGRVLVLQRGYVIG